MAAGFVGVLMVLRPDTDHFSLISLLPIASACFYAFCQILVRYARITTPASIMSLYASIAFVVMGPIAGLFLLSFAPETTNSASGKALYTLWSMPQIQDLLLLLLTGVTSAFGFMCSSKAYQHEQASRIAPFEYVMIIWVTLLSYLVWSEVPDLPTFLGVLIIIMSGIYVLRREGVNESRPIAHTGLSRR
jgi:drug/metabolite transporter (DMT)-like permease